MTTNGPDTERPPADPWPRIWTELEALQKGLDDVIERLQRIDRPALTGAVRVLIVDDDPMICAVLRRMCASEDFLITIASSGNDAIAAIAAEPFDVLLTDLKMPGNGSTLIAYMGAHAPGVAVVLMTGGSDEEAALACLVHGCFDLLHKPFPARNKVLLMLTRAAEYGRRLRIHRA